MPLRALCFCWYKLAPARNKVPAMPWTALPDSRCELGESPFWHPLENTLYWVDIAGKQLLRAKHLVGTVERWNLPDEPGCVVPVAGGGLVLALRSGIYRARQWSGPLEAVVRLPYDSTQVRANDGKADPHGRLWVGTVDESKTHNAAALYSIDCTQGCAVVQCHVAGALTGNGLAWSPDGATLYWADTPRHQVWAWDHAPHSNQLHNRRDFVQVSPKPTDWTWQDPRYQGRPDGAAVDVHGHYHSAMYEGALLCRFGPDGQLLQETPLPAQCPTMPCFGGEDLRTLFVTTARKGRSAEELAHYPDSGSVLQRRVEAPGLGVSFMRFA